MSPDSSNHLPFLVLVHCFAIRDPIPRLAWKEERLERLCINEGAGCVVSIYTGKSVVEQ